MPARIRCRTHVPAPGRVPAVPLLGGRSSILLCDVPDHAAITSRRECGGADSREARQKSADSCDKLVTEMRTAISIGFLLVFLVVLWTIFGPIERVRADNLVADPSFEMVKNRDQFGRVFAKWEGWKYEGDCSFEVGEVPHTGKTSALLVCSSAGKIRIAQTQDLEPGRYRITAYIRGLDIGTGAWNLDTEFMFDDKYFPLKKNGVFGWTRLTYVADLPRGQDRAFFRIVGAGLSVDRRRVDGAGGRRRQTHRRSGAGPRGSAHRAAGPARGRRGALPALPLPQHAGVEEVLRLRQPSGGEARRDLPGRPSNPLLRSSGTIRSRGEQWWPRTPPTAPRRCASTGLMS